MAKIRKQQVLTKKGVKIRLNDAALEIARRHFGVDVSHPDMKAVPIELLRLPKKIEIIKAVRVKEEIPDKIPDKIEVPVDTPTVEEIKKPRRKKNEGTNKQKE
jgi:hypothetical protein